MSLRSKTWNCVLFALTAIACLLASPVVMAAEEETAETENPVWVLSYAAFIFFSGAVIILAIIFSKRGDTLLDMEDKKRADQLRADRATKRRREERLAALHGRR